jgi:hypothetical protein
MEASTVTINGTEFDKGVPEYSHTYGPYDSVIIGLVKDGKWIIIEIYTLPALGANWPTDTTQDEILGTVTFD